jgi:hypothetical protein
VSEYEALRRAQCGPVMATSNALVLDILRWPDAVPGATS